MLMSFLLALEKTKAMSTRKLVLAVWNLFGEKIAYHLPTYFVYSQCKKQRVIFLLKYSQLTREAIEGNSATRVTYKIVVGIFSKKYHKESFKRGRIFN